MKKPPDEMTICNLQVLVMPNGEVLCGGKSLGWVKMLGKYLSEIPPPQALTEGNRGEKG